MPNWDVSRARQPAAIAECGALPYDIGSPPATPRRAIRIVGVPSAMPFSMFHTAAVIALLLLAGINTSAQRRVPKDLSGVRGFNYMAAGASGHLEHWLKYSATET